MRQERTLVMVLCPHRSGSSFITNLLERLGMSLGPFERLPPSQWNEHGYFEALPLVCLNDQLQERFLGFRGDSPRSPEVLRRFCQTEGRWPTEQPIPDELLTRGRDLIDRLLASGPISGFKDPPRTFVEQSRQAARRCGLSWDEAVLRQVYDPACHHQEPSAVSHPAQEAFEQLRGPGNDLDGPADPARMLAEAAGREEILNDRVAFYGRELAAMASDAAAKREQIDKLYTEIYAANCEIVRLEGELGLIKGSRTWRLRQAAVAAMHLVRPAGER
ncbi:MAG: hypothetical protein ABR915_25915 [Thermoguttaceae bacterium]